MSRKDWLWIYAALLVATLVFMIAGLAYSLKKPHSSGTPMLVEKNRPLPETSFTRLQNEYDHIDAIALPLAYATPTLQLPDLRQIVSYFGKNGRPDATGQGSFLHISLAGSSDITAVAPNTPLYLQYNAHLQPPRYIVSPPGEESSLWLLIEPQGNQASVRVNMQNEKGELIREPGQLAHFTVPEKECNRQPGKQPWELGKWRVDGSLLARQRARWFGVDRFLERHGGEEFNHTQGKQRIDFGENEEAYSIYVGPGDILVWDSSRWQRVAPGPESLGKPLMQVKKIDERLMTFELWDAEGKGKVLLNIIKSAEPLLFHNLLRQFKYVATRTRSQFVFEIQNERMVLSPNDWLLLSEEGWKKMATIEEIDAYVQRTVVGPLFIFQGVMKKGEQQVLVGSLYNKTRTDFQEIELTLQQGAEATIQKQERHLLTIVDEEEDDEDEEEEITPPPRPPIPARTMPERRES